MSGRALRMTAAEYQARSQKKQPRIRNVRRKVINGIEFASTREARAWQDLCLIQQAGQISELRRQVPFALDINGVHICDYVADFVFVRSGQQIVQDAKGFRTEIYRLKRKLMLAIHGIEIIET